MIHLSVVTISIIISIWISLVSSECIPFPITHDTQYCVDVIDYLVDSTQPLGQLVHAARNEVYPFPHCLYYNRKEYRCQKYIHRCVPGYPPEAQKLCMSVCTTGQHVRYQGYRCSDVFSSSDYEKECLPHLFSTDYENCIDLHYEADKSSMLVPIIIIVCLGGLVLALVAYLVYRRVHNMRLQQSLQRQDAVDAITPPNRQRRRGRQLTVNDNGDGNAAQGNKTTKGSRRPQQEDEAVIGDVNLDLS